MKRGLSQRLEDIDRRAFGQYAPVNRRRYVWRWGTWTWTPPVWLLAVIVIGAVALKMVRNSAAHVAGAVVVLLLIVLTVNGTYRRHP